MKIKDRVKLNFNDQTGKVNKIINNELVGVTLDNGSHIFTFKSNLTKLKEEKT